MSLKTIIAPAAHALALATGVSAGRAQKIRAGRILAFHGIGDHYFPTTAFETRLRWLTKNFNIVSLETLVNRLPSGLTNEVVLTFDDGLRNNFVHAYPVLKKYNAPATFFVVPGLVESGRWLWTHEVRARLAILPTQRREELVAGGSTQPDEQIVEHFKGLGVRDRNDAEERLRRLTTDFQPSPAQRNNYDLMSWTELQQLDPAFITIGSHSLTHPILSTLTESELVVEIEESRRMLENKLQRSVDLFCYPNGSHNPAVVRLASNHYRAAVGTEADFIRPGVTLHQLPRIGACPSAGLLAWRMHRPGA